MEETAVWNHRNKMGDLQEQMVELLAKRESEKTAIANLASAGIEPTPIRAAIEQRQYIVFVYLCSGQILYGWRPISVSSKQIFRIFTKKLIWSHYEREIEIWIIRILIRISRIQSKKNIQK